MNKLIIRQQDLTGLLGVSRATIWRWRNSGEFPKPLSLGPRLIGWRASDIQVWLNNQNQVT